MMTREPFAVIGGDLRQARAAHLLASDGFTVHAVGFDSDIEMGSDVRRARSVADAIHGCRYILLPMPLTTDGESINAPFSCNTITISEVFGTAVPGQTLFAGQVSPTIAQRAQEYGLTLVDYLKREELAVRNAVPTAEGAIQLAMEELPFTLDGSQCLVVGFGRVAKVLALKLAGLGAHVTIAARKHSDAAWAQVEGYQYIPTAQLEQAVAQADVIFNSVPAMLFDEKVLSKVKNHCLIIDLASKPGGVDFETAGRLGVKTIWALSLPGKTAPWTAGAIIKDTILNIIEEATP
ncbi:dipicolinate synthase subunit DpsA [Solibaculum mannosilyticum]|uniref:dipicolinate synthase subunit DpsA n=1 Tax=Solibaculum mannosilyticum TaxID=2780922 RepID=UPI0007A8545D|nr:dipicolinate synthase subunit DpsA [[Clostridium] leptum]CZT56984.1 Dipicolinate synthase subunit A [Eubacteriaceae bacterium CHKCI005]